MTVEEYKSEINECSIQLQGLGNYAENNADVLKIIFERYKPLIKELYAKGDSDYHPILIGFADLVPKLELLLSTKTSPKRKKEYYKELKDAIAYDLSKAGSILRRLKKP